MRRRPQRDEELTPVRPWSTIRHAHDTLAIVSERGVELILEFLAPDGFTARTVAAGEVPALDHEALDDTVEGDVVVLAGGGKGGEVVRGLLGVELVGDGG